MSEPDTKVRAAFEIAKKRFDEEDKAWRVTARRAREERANRTEPDLVELQLLREARDMLRFGHLAADTDRLANKLEVYLCLTKSTPPQRS